MRQRFVRESKNTSQHVARVPLSKVRATSPQHLFAEFGKSYREFSRNFRVAALRYRFTTDRNTLGSKYCDAGTGFSILATRTKKSVTCCSHSVMVPLL